MTTITLPDLAKGEIYAGIVLKEDGTPSHHLILLKGDKKATWEKAKEVSEKAGGDLPTRQEQSLLFANCKKHFKQDWYWSSETHASDSSYAWFQFFFNGGQTSTHKDDELRARAVRRLPI